MTVVINNKVHIRGNYKEPTDGKFENRTSEILKNLAAEGSSASESNAVKQKLQNRKLPHVRITVIKQQLEFLK